MFAYTAKTYFPGVYSIRTVYGTSRIGNRDVVGHGCNGTYVYKDDSHFPFPAIRFAANTPYISALRSKEKGDWKMLCCEEKKALYRASFCQTFAEFQHPTGLWKLVIGCVLFTTSFGFWAMMFNHFFVADELPKSLSIESRKAQLRRMIDIRTNPVDGLGSLWNYDEDCWKSEVSGVIKRESEFSKSPFKPKTG